MIMMISWTNTVEGRCTLSFLIFMLMVKISNAWIVIHLRMLIVSFIDLFIFITIKDLWLWGQNSWVLSYVLQSMNLIRIIWDYTISEKLISQRKERSITVGPNWWLEIWVKISAHSFTDWRSNLNQINNILIVWLYRLFELQVLEFSFDRGNLRIWIIDVSVVS